MDSVYRILCAFGKQIYTSMEQFVLKSMAIRNQVNLMRNGLPHRKNRLALLFLLMPTQSDSVYPSSINRRSEQGEQYHLQGRKRWNLTGFLTYLTR